MKLELESRPFHLYSDFYDLLYNDKDYLNESRYIDKILRTYNRGSRSLLELGCGTGNYACHLADLGYTITGIEKAKPLAQIAKSKKIKGFELIVDDIVSFSLEKKFDAAISLFHVMSYLDNNEKMILCLKQVSRHLRPGGLFIFDVWYTPAVYYQKPHPRVKKVENEIYEITRFAEPVIFPQTNAVEVNYEMIVNDKLSGQSEFLKESHRMRHFGTPEIRLFAELSGFDLIRSEEFLTSKDPGTDTWGVCYILKKR